MSGWTQYLDIEELSYQLLNPVQSRTVGGPDSVKGLRSRPEVTRVAWLKRSWRMLRKATTSNVKKSIALVSGSGVIVWRTGRIVEPD